jgi:sulfopyruvate decarboxylase TPP-binding subunit
MILSIRTFTIQDGKQREAISALVAIAKYVNETLDGAVYVERNISGPQNQVHLISERESLAAWESAMKKTVADERLWGMISEFEATFVLGHNLLLVEKVS